LDIYNDIEENNHRLIGIYHTHPAPPYPSRTDIQYMEVNFCVWLISSTKKPANPKGYLLDNNSLKEITIKIID
jgi:proteasome lid subunit RPN8/RPN11